MPVANPFRRKMKIDDDLYAIFIILITYVVLHLIGYIFSTYVNFTLLRKIQAKKCPKDKWYLLNCVNSSLTNRCVQEDFQDELNLIHLKGNMKAPDLESRIHTVENEYYEYIDGYMKPAYKQPVYDDSEGVSNYNV